MDTAIVPVVFIKPFVGENISQQDLWYSGSYNLSNPTAPAPMAQDLFYFNYVYVCACMCEYVYIVVQVPAESGRARQSWSRHYRWLYAT